MFGSQHLPEVCLPHASPTTLSNSSLFSKVQSSFTMFLTSLHKLRAFMLLDVCFLWIRVPRPSNGLLFFSNTSCCCSCIFLFSGEVGFLAEHRRINVAITRARRHLAVVADSETVSHDEFLKSLVEYMSSEGEVRSAHEYLQDSLPTVADSFTWEHEELLTKTRRDYKNVKGFVAKKNESKERDSKEKDGLKSSDTMEDKTRHCEPKKSTANNFSPQDSTHVSNDSSSPEGISEKPDMKEMSEPVLSTSNTAEARYSRETLEKEILDFIQDASKLELSFPKTLNSQQRFDVHIIAEKLSISHESRGEGKDRYIVVGKVKPASKGLFCDSVILKKVSFDNEMCIVIEIT